MTGFVLVIFLIVSYYIIIKAKSNTIEKIFSLGSFIMFMVATTPIWNESLFDAMIEKSIFIPFIAGIVGIFFGWVGIKGGKRASFVLINILAVLFYLTVFLIGTIGFQEP